MAAARGLNKGRGLGSLIPTKADAVSSPEVKKENIGKNEEKKADSSKSAAAAKKAVAEKSTESVKKAPASKKSAESVKKAPASKKSAVSVKKTPAAKKDAEVTKKTSAAKKAAGPEKAAEKKKSAAETTKKPAAAKAAVKSEKPVKAPTKPAKPVKAPTEPAKPDEIRTEQPTELQDKPGVEVKSPTDEILTIRLTEIVPNHEQPRKRFDEGGIEELAASIKEHGIVTPLLVQKKGKYYELIAGERRWRAAKLAGLKKVPVLLREFSEQQAAEIALIENIQRENLNAMEEAMAFKRLQEDFSLKQEDIAKRVSRSRSAITNSLRLLKLEPSVQEMLAEGRLSMGHARALLAIEDQDTQRITAEQVAANDLSVRETEKLVKRLLSPKKTVQRRTVDEQMEAIYRNLEEQLRKEIGTRVSIRPMRGKKGMVEIEYYSEEDLERIIERLRQS